MRQLALVVCTLVLTGCSVSFGGVEDLTQSALEEQVAANITPDDPDAEVSADCAGGLAAEVDATQECHLDVGEEEADVRATVTKVNDEDVDFELSTYVPPDVVASTIKDSLAAQDVTVDTVECDDELRGEVDAKTMCTAAPADGEGRIEVTVTSVDGLMVNFGYEVVS